MITQTLDGIPFSLRETHDFSWLSRLGKVFCVFDQNDSGNISFGVRRDAERFFIKYAGAQTLNACITPEEAVQNLKRSIPIYEVLRHPALIELIDFIEFSDAAAAVFRWAEGDCLFDHWNFDFYAQHPEITSPGQRFRALPLSKRLSAVETLFSFLSHTAACGYTAVDFYDGSILYDFAADRVTICDIDLFQKGTVVNKLGEAYWGTKRLKAPEEYQYGGLIDERTNVFTLGALLFHLFGTYSEEEIHNMYEHHAFSPCKPEYWQLSPALYEAALFAVQSKKESRYPTIAAFQDTWEKAQ